MTVIVKIGRRVPVSFRSRMIHKIKGLLGFQENIWLMTKMSFEMSQRQYKNGSKKAKGHLTKFDIDRKVEVEDTFWKLEWLIITIMGDEECETAEYEEACNMYMSLKHTMKKFPKDAEKDERLASVFKTKLINEDKLKEAYTAGYGAKKDKTISEIMLEMGMLTHIDWIKDFEERNGQTDF